VQVIHRSASYKMSVENQTARVREQLERSGDTIHSGEYFQIGTG